jgi:hypothetical protein
MPRRSAPAEKPGPKPGSLDDEPKHWLTLPKASRFAKVSPRQILEWVDQGDVRAEYFEGQKRFSEEDLALMMGRIDPDSRHILDTLSEQLRALFKLTTEPTQKLLSLFSEETERLRKRIDALEERHLGTLKAYEDALSLQHERALEIRVTERQQDRIDLGVKSFKEWLPRLAREAMGRTKVQKVIESLSDEQIVFLNEMEAITPAQGKLLAQIRDESKADAKKATGLVKELGLEGEDATPAEQAAGEKPAESSPTEAGDAEKEGSHGSQEKDAADGTTREPRAQANGARTGQGSPRGTRKGSGDG